MTTTTSAANTAKVFNFEESIKEGIKDGIKESIKDVMKEGMKEYVQECIREIMQESIQESMKKSIKEGIQEGIKECIQKYVEKENMKKLEKQDDNFDTDPKYEKYWFAGRKRITGYEITPDIYYSIRPKNAVWSYPDYKLKDYKDVHIIVMEYRFDEDKYNKKIIELDMDTIYAYEIKN